MKNHYFVEMTDTFGGEANYCWVNRFIVSASSPRGAMRLMHAAIAIARSKGWNHGNHP